MAMGRPSFSSAPLAGLLDPLLCAAVPDLPLLKTTVGRSCVHNHPESGGMSVEGAPMRTTASALLVLSLVQLSGCASESTVSASEARIPPVPPGLARVWVLRQFSPGLATQWAPITYVNGAILAPSYAGTAFYRDFPAGTYDFTVASCVHDFNSAQRLQLASGVQANLEVQVLSDFGTWGCFDPNTYYVRQIPRERAEYYFQQVRYLGSR